MNATLKTIFWRMVAIGTTMLALLVWIGLLSSCTAKKTAAFVSAPVVIYGDTTRVKLVHRADASSDTLTIISGHNKTTVTNYEKSVRQYDSIKVALP